MNPTAAPSAEFLAVFRAEAGPDATLAFDRFMELALYHPRVGYYRRERPRVGYAPGTDFFTASSSGPIFGEIVAETCRTLLDGRDPREFTFVEIGAEPSPEAAGGAGVLAGIAHPFGAARTVPIGEPPVIEGKCVVFSNELFDAQPCRRFGFRQGAWRERAVQLRDGGLAETDRPVADAPFLPATAPEGSVVDAPCAAVALLERIAAQPWTGLFVACDYGKSWKELTEGSPAGTLRAYHRHRQSNDLLARPGEQDLTGHVCWDWLVEALGRQGFPSPQLESQEAFFVRHASAFLAKTSEAEAAGFSQRKLALMQLLHPAHMGQKFQVLHAQRF